MAAPAFKPLSSQRVKGFFVGRISGKSKRRFFLGPVFVPLFRSSHPVPEDHVANPGDHDQVLIPAEQNCPVIADEGEGTPVRGDWRAQTGRVGW